MDIFASSEAFSVCYLNPHEVNEVTVIFSFADGEQRLQVPRKPVELSGLAPG